MEHFKMFSKKEDIVFLLLSKFGSDGYVVYYETMRMLAEGNYLRIPRIVDLGFLAHEFQSVTEEKIIDIYRFLSTTTAEDGNPNLVFSEIQDGELRKISLLIPGLEKRNREFARKHAAILDRQGGDSAARQEEEETCVSAIPDDASKSETPAVGANGKPKRIKIPKKKKMVPEDEAEPIIRDMVKCWNLIEGVMHCACLTDKRKEYIRTRLFDPYFAQNWKEAMRKVAQSDFCCGLGKPRNEGERPFRASFDWFIRDDGKKSNTVVMTMEGLYDNRGGRK